MMHHKEWWLNQWKLFNHCNFVSSLEYIELSHWWIQHFPDEGGGANVIFTPHN